MACFSGKMRIFAPSFLRDTNGALAHLVERFVRIEKVGGSSPLCSTKPVR